MKSVGLDTVLRNLNTEIQKIHIQQCARLRKVGLLVKREAQRKCPVNTGDLKTSAYTELMEKGVMHTNFYVVIGFTASYAPFVHEMPGTLKGLPRPRPHKGFYWDPQDKAEPQFLRNALLENAERILRILSGEMEIK